MDKDPVKRAAELIANADSLIIAAGAGMGVDSGLPDFRGSSGFLNNHSAFANGLTDYKQLSQVDAFKRDIRHAWGFYGQRLTLYRDAIPHEGFALLKKWGEAKPNGYFIYTSNVDGQFQKAGFDRSKIYECHGSLHHLQCLDPCGTKIWPAGDFVPDVDVPTCKLKNAPPECKSCGGDARPNMLMFDDTAWLSNRSDIQKYNLDAWLSSSSKPVVIEIGAGTTVPSVRHFSYRAGRLYGARLIRINPHEAEVESLEAVGLSIGGLAGLKAISKYLS